MIDSINPAQMDRLVTVQTNTETLSSGDLSDSWATTFTTYAKEMKASGGETLEQNQPVRIARRAYLIRKEDRTFSAATMRFKEGDDSTYFYMTEWHYFKGSRNFIVIEGEQRD